MGKIYQHYLSGARIWSCSNCHTHLAHYEDIISKVKKKNYINKIIIFHILSNFKVDMEKLIFFVQCK